MGEGQEERKVERQMKLVSPKTKHQAEERRSKFWIYGTGIVLILALIGTVTSAMLVEKKNKSQLIAAAKKPIDGVQTSTGLSQAHTSTPATPSELPPVGGDHAPTWISCGIYTTPINTSEAVHSLEHGAVWVTYRPDLPRKQIGTLTEMAKSNPYQLLSPYPGLASPVVATAWGKQLKLDNAQDSRLVVFLKAYLQGPQTPEPGAAC